MEQARAAAEAKRRDVATRAPRGQAVEQWLREADRQHERERESVRVERKKRGSDGHAETLMRGSEEGGKEREVKQIEVALTDVIERERRYRDDDRPRPHKCEKCDAAFHYKSNLVGHQITHSSDRPFKCTTCGNSFKRSHALKKHMKIHTRTGVKPYKCDTCEKAYYYAGGLRKHLASKHQATVVKPYKCATCEKAYYYSWGLQRHLVSKHQADASITHQPRQPSSSSFSSSSSSSSSDSGSDSDSDSSESSSLSDSSSDDRSEHDYVSL